MTRAKKTVKTVPAKTDDKKWIVWVVFWSGLFTFLTVLAIVGDKA